MNPQLNPLGFALWYVTLICAGVYGLHLYREGGYEDGYALAAAQGAKTLADVLLSHAEERQSVTQQTLDETRDAFARAITEQQRADQLARQLADTQRLQRQTTERLQGEIKHVTTLYRRALDKPAEPLPASVFTVGFVRVWNSANGNEVTTHLPASTSPERTASPPATAAATDQLDSGISQGDLLKNHTRNAESYASCRAQLNGLIDWTLNANQ